MILDTLAARLRARSARLLATAIACELAGAAGVLLFWPRGWALGLVLLMTAALRVFSLAERTRGATHGSATAIYSLVRYVAVLTSLVAALVLALGALRVIMGGGWV